MDRYLAVPAGAGRRIDTDIAELDVPGSTKPTDTDEPPEENGEPRRWAEFVTAASAVILIGLMLVPYEIKKGQVWYQCDTICRVLVLR